MPQNEWTLTLLQQSRHIWGVCSSQEGPPWLLKLSRVPMLSATQYTNQHTDAHSSLPLPTSITHTCSSDHEAMITPPSLSPV